MEKYKCKICYRNFANGRALGGHMRSHMLNLYVPPKTEQLGQEAESTQSSSSSDEEENQKQEEEEEDKGVLIYGLRENPKKSIRLVDPEFSFTAATCSVVLDQDRESETESSKNHQIVPRRSKRIRKSGISENHFVHNHGDYEYIADNLKKPKLINEKFGNNLEAEAVSSISGTTTEEDVAYCLIMLSRDKWRREKNEEEEFEEKYIDVQYDPNDDDSDEEEGIKVNKIAGGARAKYRCETCDKVFRSYQALGGHRASHKKVKSMNAREQIFMAETEKNAGVSTMVVEEKRHECPVCFRVFASGQALGGHKRTHVIGSSPSSAAANNRSTSTSTNSAKPFTRNGERTLIDLNLPAPIDDDDDDDEFSQIELSAVSDAEFVHP